MLIIDDLFYNIIVKYSYYDSRDTILQQKSLLFRYRQKFRRLTSDIHNYLRAISREIEIVINDRYFARPSSSSSNIS